MLVGCVALTLSLSFDCDLSRLAISLKGGRPGPLFRGGVPVSGERVMGLPRFRGGTMVNPACSGVELGVWDAWVLVGVVVKVKDTLLSLEDAGEAPSPRRRSDSIQKARRLA
jgi:hypothetical protein